MNVLTKIINLLRSENNKEDYQKLNTWKSEAEETLANLPHGHFDFEKAIDDMQGYKIYDKSNAYQNITGDDLATGKVRSMTRLAISSAAAVILITLGTFFILNKEIDFKSEIVSTNGIIKVIKLEDRSIVTLDNESTLTTLDKRKIALNGRAYFQVQSTPDKANFVIKLNKGIVTVLGTKFSINTNSSTNFISVEEGKVRYEYQDKKIIVTAGQSVALVNNELVGSNNTANAFSWKTQILEFIDTPVEQAISDISKHYNINIEIEKSVTMKSHCLLTTKVKNESIEQFMKVLKSIFDITYYKKGSGFVITSIKC
jgi:transmembrane sensor